MIMPSSRADNLRDEFIGYIVFILEEKFWRTVVNCQLVCQLAKILLHVGGKAASVLININSGFPLGLENQGNEKAFSSEGKVREFFNRLEQSGKITQNTGKVRVFQTNVIYYFLVIFKWTVYYMLKWSSFTLKNKPLKYWKNRGEYWKSRGILSVRKVGTMSLSCETVLAKNVSFIDLKFLQCLWTTCLIMLYISCFFFIPLLCTSQ